MRMTEPKAKSVRALLCRPRRWIKYDWANDSRGNPVMYYDADACRFCLLGAIRHVYWRDWKECDRVVTMVEAECRKRLGWPSKTYNDPITAWNDAPYRRFSSVQALVRKLAI